VESSVVARETSRSGPGLVVGLIPHCRWKGKTPEYRAGLTLPHPAVLETTWGTTLTATAATQPGDTSWSLCEWKLSDRQLPSGAEPGARTLSLDTPSVAS